MKLILTHEVAGLGAAGDVVEVRDGYGRNYLLPRRLATPWTKGAEKDIAAIRKAREVRQISTLEAAQEVKASLESSKVKVVAKTGNGGRLFGAISAGNVADAVKAAGGPDLDRRAIEVPAHIKSVGSYAARVRLHPEVQATVPFEVVSA